MICSSLLVLNKPVGCVLLVGLPGVSVACCIIALKKKACPSADTLHPWGGYPWGGCYWGGYPCGGYPGVGKVFEITKGIRVLAHFPDDINAALRVAIDRFQCIRVLQARFVNVMKTDDSHHLP